MGCNTHRPTIPWSRSMRNMWSRPSSPGGANKSTFSVASSSFCKKMIQSVERQTTNVKNPVTVGALNLAIELTHSDTVVRTSANMASANRAAPSAPRDGINRVLLLPGMGHFATTTIEAGAPSLCFGTLARSARAPLMLFVLIADAGPLVGRNLPCCCSRYSCVGNGHLSLFRI